MLKWLFLRKADFKKVQKILEKENFIYTKEDVLDLLKGNQKGLRYGNKVLERKEEGETQKRFLKVQIDGAWKTYKPFRRQVEVTKALAQDDKYNFPKLSILSFSLNPPVPYAVFETREDGGGFGFMHDDPAYYEGFTEEEVRSIAKIIYGFHLAGLEVNKEIFKHIEGVSNNIGKYKKGLGRDLNKVITHKFVNGSVVNRSVGELLSEYMSISDLQSKAFEMLEKSWKHVGSSRIAKGRYLVHADMQIDNIYKHKNGGYELLDFEWVKSSNNPVISIMYDYGNLRSRAWSSPQFQKTLDKAMFDEGVRLYNNPDLVKAALTLGALRSGLGIARYHLDYSHTLRNARRTEEYYFNMFPKTIASIKELFAENR
jgi:hypothetical protein